MHIIKLLFLLIVFVLHVPFAMADSVTILSPVEGARLSRTEQTMINYDVMPGSRGDHLHLYVDKKKTGALRQMKGSHPLELSAPGKHEICIELANKGHAEIGVSKCIIVSVE